MKLAVSLVLCALIVAGLCWGTIWRASLREPAFAALTPTEGQYVIVDGVRIHAVVMGKDQGQGPDLVLIHGASGNWRDMTFALAPALAGRYRVIVLDRPGMGYSDRLPDQSTSAFATTGESPEAQARILQKAAAQLGANRPIVVGHSFGGAVALAWASYLPENISALVDLAGAVNVWPGELDIQYRVMNTPLGAAMLPPLVSAFISPDYVKGALDGVFAPDPTPQGYDAHFNTMQTLSRARFRANAQQVNALKGYLAVQSQLYSGITAPTEIVHGTADTIVPLDIHSRPLAAILPGAHLTVIDGAGHMLHQTHLQVVLDAIDRAAVRAGLN